MPGASQIIEIACPRDAFYRIITDFEAYPRFLSDIKTASVVRHEGEVWDVSFVARVIKDVEYTLRLTGRPPEALTWHLLEGRMFKKSDGGWSLEDLGGGRTRASYQIDVALSAFVPSAIANRLVQYTLPAMLQEWKEHAEALHQEGCI